MEAAVLNMAVLDKNDEKEAETERTAIAGKAELAKEAAKQQLCRYAHSLETALASYLPRCPLPESQVADAMGYSLLGGGKRIRGSLVLAFYHLYHEDIAAALPYAGALEMIHAFSLIHDDLPCMDDDDLRRGKPSCHKAFGEAQALLAGDALLDLAFEVMTDPCYSRPFPAARVLQVVHCLARATGLGGMIGGQAIDLAQEGQSTPSELLERMYKLKTGALLAIAAETGCILAGADREACRAAVEYADRLGFAFQIKDDILDITGDAALLGKPIGSDEANGKTTFVRLYGLAAAQREVDRLNTEAKKALDKLPGDTRFLRELADMLVCRQS